jgi:hypothetical protein
MSIAHYFHWNPWPCPYLRNPVFLKNQKPGFSKKPGFLTGPEGYFFINCPLEADIKIGAIQNPIARSSVKLKAIEFF